MMSKTYLAVLVVVFFAMTLPAFSVSASVQPVIYRTTITVTKEGGRYQAGFVDVVFNKNDLEKGMEPVTFDIEVYANKGISGVSFSPHVPRFYEKIDILVNDYNGLLYDVTTGQNIRVNVHRQRIVAKYFSWYPFR